MKRMQIRAFREEDEEAVIALWHRCDLVRPWNDPRKDIARKAGAQPELFLVGLIDGSVVASVMGGYEGHRGWINYLAVAPECQGRGHGRTMMMEAERLLRERGCPKINLQIRRGNTAVTAFYSHLGYRDDDVVSMGKRLDNDDAPPPNEEA